MWNTQIRTFHDLSGNTTEVAMESLMSVSTSDWEPATPSALSPSPTLSPEAVWTGSSLEVLGLEMECPNEAYIA